jgi:serine/threonine protein kinase
LNEINLLQRSRHPNIIHLVETYYYRSIYYLVFELAKFPLSTLIAKSDIPEE